MQCGSGKRGRGARRAAGGALTRPSRHRGSALMIPNMYKMRRLTPFCNATSPHARSRARPSRSSAPLDVMACGRPASRCCARLGRGRPRLRLHRQARPSSRASVHGTSSPASAPRMRSERSRSSRTRTCLHDRRRRVSAHRHRRSRPTIPCFRTRRTRIRFPGRRGLHIFHDAVARDRAKTFDRFAERVGAATSLRYVGSPQAERVVMPHGLRRGVAHEPSSG